MPKKIIAVHPEGSELAGQPTGVIVWQFEDKTEQSLDINELSEAIRFRLAIHGASQKGGDSYAGAKGEPDPVAFAKEAVKEVIEQLKAGQWRTTSPGGPKVTDLATAFAQVEGVTVEEAVEFIGGLTDEEVKALRAKPRVKATLAAITAKRAAEKAAKALADAEKAEKEEAAKAA